jgi:DEAD/DEAH box helicase domain-containing protein
MNPILLGKHVEQSLRELVHSTLNTTSPGFKGSVEGFLGDSHHFIKGPWVTVDLPYKSIADENGNWPQPFPEIPLKFAPYIHQYKAFERLSKQERSTLIATGTGSGKTESYLWPILDYCRKHQDKPGIKAILIYPMNALATDQARRVASAITSNSSLSGVTAGIYADREPRLASDSVTTDSLITRRETMRTNPPDILLTNYKMLDYLLLRGDDLPLWSKNEGETLKFLVVDEIHTFDGAQGADLALLLRRLKYRLTTPKNHLVCVGSSATLGTGEEAEKELIKYAERVFGEPFLGDAVIRETRNTATEALEFAEYVDVPDLDKLTEVVLNADSLNQQQAAKVFTQCLFSGDDDEDVQTLLSIPAESSEFRLLLGNVLKEHWYVARIIKAISEHNGPMSIDDLTDYLHKAKLLRKSTRIQVQMFTELVISLICWARSGQDDALRPLFNVRVQAWVREMSRMVATLPWMDDADNLQPCTLHHADDLEAEELNKVLPVVNCQRCGTSAHIGRENVGGGSYHAPLETIYAEFFDEANASKLRLFYTDKIELRALKASEQQVYPGLLTPESLEFVRDDRQLDRSNGRIPAWMYFPATTGIMDKTCPACGYEKGLVLFGIRATRLTATISSTLFMSEQNEVEANEKPRFLLFSDSVQDAAQRGAVTEVRNTQTVIQKSLFQKIDSVTSITLADLTDDFPKAINTDMGADNFVSSFIPRDMTWRKAYQSLVSQDTPITEAKIQTLVQNRLGWSIFEDLTFKSHLLSSLEGRGIANCDVEYAQLSETSEKFLSQLKNNFQELDDITLDEVKQFIFGVLQKFRKQGSISLLFLRRAIEKSNQRGYLNSFALGRDSAMPTLNPQKGISPRPVSLVSGLMHFDYIAGEKPSNTYLDWLYRVLIGNRLTLSRPRELYQLLFDRLVMDDWIDEIFKDNDDERAIAYLLKPEKLTASTDINYLQCDHCHRQEVIKQTNFNYLIGIACSRISCAGLMQPYSKPKPASLLRSLHSDRNHRVVAREHTGLLDTDTRLSIEQGFIDGENPWSPNLISATPTLEMGIDIGDLSTLLLCSVPPEEANYVQRMGRTGRRDGNALNLVLANSRPHDLQFWEDPTPMLRGEVKAPGVYIGAESVLIRQLTAFTLDAYVLDSKISGDFGKVSDVRKRRASKQITGFPMDWLAFVSTHGQALVNAFVGLLPDDIQNQKKLVGRLTDYVVNNSNKSLQWSVLQLFDEADAERARLVDKREELTKEKRKLKARAAEFTPEKLKEMESAIEQDRKEINRLIRNGIDDVSVIKFLTDKGRLPNYAFPEEGVKLTSLLARRGENKEGDEDSLVSLEYQRPASTALSEFALGQTFYANGRQVEISRLDMTSEDISKWRFCQTCSHAENTALEIDKVECPKCGDDMWQDSGALHEVIELKSVLAISSEDKSAIRDSDQRTQVFFDRAMLPFYEDKDITAAWYSADERASAPFGYELIADCTFRDFNFGSKENSPTGPKIGGQHRKSRPFKLCRHCGTKQSKYLREEDQGEHPPSCQVIKMGIKEQPEWLTHSFLMRFFNTEAIRLIIPVVGDVDNDEIKSFVAAINLGMHRHFAGRVDHIRSTVVEAQIDGYSTVRSLYLYDSVPGGSGYLRQLANNPAAMKTVFESAFQALDNCPCIQEEKLGCYRCVKPYRSQFGPGEPRRDMARNMIEKVLKQWDSLTKSSLTLDDQLANSLIRSELETLFLKSLQGQFGEKAIVPKVIGDGSLGFLLSIDNKPAWTIEPQVQMENRLFGMPKKDVDFYLTPIDSSTGLKPIVIETDGLRYHADTVGKDIIDRLQMIRTGKVLVWSLSWHDLQVKSKPYDNPLLNSAMEPQSQGMLGRVMAHFKAETPLIKSLQEHDSFSLLVERLKGIDSHLPLISMLTRGIVGQGATPKQLPQISTLRSENKLWLEECEFGATTTKGFLDLFITVNKVQPAKFPEVYDDIHVLLNFNAKLPTKEAGISEAFTSAFRGFWRTVNALQELKLFHVEYPQLDTLDIPSIETDQGDQDIAWLMVNENVLDDYHSVVTAMIASQLPVPDLFGEELMDGKRVIGATELGWSHCDVWLSDDHSINQDNVVIWDLESSTIPDVIAQLSAKLA